MTQHKTFCDFEKNSAHEQRLLFVDAGSDGEQSSESGSDDSSELSRDWRQYPNQAAFESVLDKLVRDGKIEVNEKAKLEKTAAHERVKEETQQSEQTKVAEVQKAVGLIENADRTKIDKKLASQIDKKYIGDLAELRAATRNELLDLGIKQEVSEEEIVKKKMETFGRETEKRIKNILNQTRKHHRIFDEIEEEERLAKKCFKKMTSLFDTHDPNKKDFLDALRLKQVPQGATLSEKRTGAYIEEIIKYRNKFASDPDGTLGGVTGEKLFLLEHSLRDIETLYEKWQTADISDKADLQWRLGEYEKSLGRMKFEIESNSERSLENKQLTENWESFLNYKKNDIEHLRTLFAKKPSKSDLKLVAAFLDGNEEELKKMRDDFEAALQAEAAAKAEAATPIAEKKTTAADEHAKDHADDHDGGHHEVNNIFTRFGKKFVETMTLKGNIRWYSWYDISGTFKLITESWEKHIESVSEDKRGPLAQKAMFWKKEVVRRIHHKDIADERGRADELKKTYKNFDDKQLLAELKELPAKDRRRAILESLADRGNLRMSNQELLKIVCPGKFGKAAWETADTSADYTPMRERFKKDIDGWFVGEDNYGKELLEMHNAGFSKAEGNGKSYAGSNESTSTRAEVHNVGNQIQRALQEGEGTIVGILDQMFDRANAFSDNGQFADVKIKLDGAQKDITRSADMGLVGLLITDAFVQKKLSRELMMKIGKGNEQCFRPFATFQQVVGGREITDPFDPAKKRKISQFEYWGWIDREKGITELGSTQIINFFNTRNARAEIETPSGKIEKIIHMASDSCFKTHSGARVTSIEQARKGIGDKFTGYVTKASTIDIVDQATRIRRDTGGATGEIREIAGMITAAVEDFIDGKMMIDNGQERYFDSFTKKEVDEKGYFLDDPTKERIPVRQMEQMGDMRAERGKAHILRILKNMWLYREDREILSNQPTYKIYDYDTTDEGAARDKGAGHEKSEQLGGGPLKQFLENALGKKWGNTAEYKEIMAAYDQLADPNRKLTRAEIEIAKNYKGEVNSREDLQKASRSGSRISSEEPY